MKNRFLKNHRHAAGWNLDRIPSSIAAGDKSALGRTDDEKKVSIVWAQHFIHHLAPQTALRDSAFVQREASPQVVSKAQDNMAGFVLANDSISSNQSSDCPARSVSSKPKAKPQSLPRQRDIRRALIEADREMSSDELRTPNRFYSTSIFEIDPSNFTATLPGQLFYNTQIPVCLWFSGKGNTLDSANDARLFNAETELNLVV